MKRKTDGNYPAVVQRIGESFGGSSEKHTKWLCKDKVYDCQYHAHYYQKDGRSANALCGVFGFVCTQLQAQICGCTVAKHKGKRQCDDGHWHNYVCGTVAKVAYSSADEYLIYYII